MKYSYIICCIIATLQLNQTILSMSRMYRPKPTAVAESIVKNFVPSVSQRLRKNMYDLYHITEHPFIQPIYAGYKGSKASAELRDYINSSYDFYQNSMLGQHQYFKQHLYDPWIDHLDQYQRQSFAQDIENYNQALHDYQLDPTNSNAHTKLIEQSMHILTLIKDTAISTPRRLRSYRMLPKKLSPIKHLEESEKRTDLFDHIVE